MAAPHGDNEEPHEDEHVNGPARTGPAGQPRRTPPGAGRARATRLPPGTRPSAPRSMPRSQPPQSPRPAPPGPQGSTAAASAAWGSRPARLGPITVVFGALAGGLLTVLAGAEPGWLLGLFVLAATAVGATAVRREAAYLVIPVPALAAFVVAFLAGLIHDRGVDASRTVLAVNALQWMAGSFFWMCLATVLAIAITAGRWLMTGRAGYRRGATWLGRVGLAAPPAGRAAHGPATGSSRALAARPPSARTGEPGSAQRGRTGTGAGDPDGGPDGGTGRTQPLGHEELDTEPSAEA
jgi:hypothetical protein